MKNSRFYLLATLSLMIAAALVFQSCDEEENETTNNAPTCSITNPSFGAEITQGETVMISVEAEDEDNNLNEVRFYIDGTDVGSSNSFPYNYEWETVDASEGSHTIKAVALDEEQAEAEDEVEVTIVSVNNNTPPTASFTVSPSSGSTSTNFAFDATGSTDNEDPTSQIEVRWDFDGDGSWDTDWDTDKTVSHQFSIEDTYTAKLEVKDAEGLTDQYTRNITVSDGGGTTGSFTDPRDGQTYETVEIGNQIWFAENLNYETSNSWWYDNDPDNGEIYGRLYKWESALSACPDGWHLPSHDEWNIVVDYLGGSNIAGGKMKEAGTTHWNSPNAGATNSSGFSALPGGQSWYYIDGSFRNLGIMGVWWSSTEYVSTQARYLSMINSSDGVSQSSENKDNGFSVRCLKD